jgi:hypothetical protein
MSHQSALYIPLSQKLAALVVLPRASSILPFASSFLSLELPHKVVLLSQFRNAHLQPLDFLIHDPNLPDNLCIDLDFLQHLPALLLDLPLPTPRPVLQRIDDLLFEAEGSGRHMLTSLHFLLKIIVRKYIRKIGL